MKLIVVNGFLGSGKTTYIRSLLAQLDVKFAVILNEFGQANVDAELFDSSLPVDSIQHGSIFCTCKSEEFVSVLGQRLREPFDLILIESSGFADPSGMDALIRQALVNTGQTSIEVCAISVLEATTFLKLVDAMAMLKKQVATADVILLNQSDRTSQEDMERLSQRVASINDIAPRYRTNFANLDPSDLLFHKVEIDQRYPKSSAKDISASQVSVVCGEWKDEASIASFLREIAPLVLRAKGNVKTQNDAFRVQIASGQILLEPRSESNNTLVLLYSSAMTSATTLLGILGNYLTEFRRI
jgi:G3E family GTPase